MPKPRIIFTSLLGLALLPAAGGTSFLLRHYRVSPMPVTLRASLPVPHLKNGTVDLTMPNGNLVGQVGSYPSELGAYLRLEYLRSLKPLSGVRILIRATPNGDGAPYRLYVVLPNHLIQETDRLAQLEAGGYIPGFALSSPPSSQIQSWAWRTHLLSEAYDSPPQEPLLRLPRGLLTTAVSRFILFKIKTDPRVRLSLVRPDKVLSPKESLQFATDMIDVASFYHIPLSMFIGIGAMENNFIDVRGDLDHDVWRRHRQPGDLVLARRRGWYLIKDYSLGPWQITQSTLRYAHLLYLRNPPKDSTLPSCLRPPRRLNPNHVSTPVLTTYAGLLLSNLLAEFHGNLQKAAGAYNGGRGRPNLKYAQGVALVATYAHRVITQAVRNEQSEQMLQNSPAGTPGGTGSFQSRYLGQLQPPKGTLPFNSLPLLPRSIPSAPFLRHPQPHS